METTPPAPDAAPAGDRGSYPILLQNLVCPDPEITGETLLFLRLSGGATLDGDRTHLPTGSTVAFDTYVNLFDITNWTRHCLLGTPWLRLHGYGRVRLDLWCLTGADRPLLTCDLDLTPEGVRVDLPGLSDTGLLALRLTALGPACLDGGAWLTDPPDTVRPNQTRPVSLAIVITTFRREAAVARTAVRITDHLDRMDPGAAAHLFVIDNGNSATLPPHPALTRIANRNLGGAGGFARGLAAAEDGRFTHALFMDDDAAFQMENLVRTLAFLRLARTPETAVAGAMISNGQPHMMWENGAVFDRFCRPCHQGTDLRDAAEVAAMLIRSAQPKPAGFYGGWWFFAFPLAAVEYYPFPFFVRGDDISFSLAHRFDTATLNGVMSVQEDFAVKESPQTLYLDLRNHLHHHLTQDGMQIGAGATAGLALRFILRSLLRMHYDSAEAQLLAWADVMTGPGHFVTHVDMAARRATLSALTRQEIWRPLAKSGLPPPRRAVPPSLLFGRAMKLTLNGHLVPGFGWLGRRVVLNTADRAPIWPLWGARAARFVDPDSQRSYTVHHTKARFLVLAGRAIRQSWQWVRAHDRLVAAYRAAYPQMASRAFWETQFADPGSEPRGPRVP